MICYNVTMLKLYRLIIGIVVLVTAGCSDTPLNTPYPDSNANDKVLYTSFGERPKHLDPARSYASNEAVFNSQIYEPLLQYHLLKRPYQLVPLTLTSMPSVINVEKDGERYSVYTLRIKSGIYYQPHPAFAKDGDNYRFYPTTPKHIPTLFDGLNRTDTRELIAEDYAYQIKRLADPSNHSPIYGLMSKYILGLPELRQRIKNTVREPWLDLRFIPLSGVQVVDRYTLNITLRGNYPQFKYWLAMNFFAPIPWEADRLYQQQVLRDANINFDWRPVGTGPFMLTKNDPNSKMVLERNPNFHGEAFPGTDIPLPLIDKVVFSLEKESIPRWSKFLQGYYDSSGINSDSFDQAINMAQNEASLTEDMANKDIKLVTSVAPTTFYFGFNMNDPVVGGLEDSHKKLRQAIAIAFDYEEYISIFLNGRGIVAHSPLPEGIFGYTQGKDGINPITHIWHQGKAKRRPLAEAKALLSEAGFPNGINPKTGKPLVLYFDTTATGPDDASLLNWYRKQFAKLNIQLVIRDTDYNRFQEKMRTGKAQLFSWGWNADYPDPENFLFLLHGSQAKVSHNGENAANYQNPKYDALFEQMQTMENSPQRQQIIDKMIKILREDSPWLFGFHPKSYGLYHQWYTTRPPNSFANNNIKYVDVNPQLRLIRQKQWNSPLLWPLGLAAIVLLLFIVIPIIGYYYIQQNRRLRDLS
jgi:oligopeptide transport system substrate-binding protein